LTAILTLEPEIAEKLHPFAVKWFDELRGAIEKQLETDGLTVDDVESLLSQDEKGELQREKSEIQMALLSCGDHDATSPGMLFNSGFGPAFLMMQLRSFTVTDKIKSLLRKAYERKAAARSEPVRKKNELKRRTRAFEALNPPIALARKYLTDPAEYLRFEMSISGAVDAYLEAGELYGSHEKAKEYGQCMEMIEDRQREEARKQRARSDADAYSRRLNEEIRELTSQLCQREENLSGYFRAAVRDKRYSGHGFEYILSTEEKRKLDLVLVSVANKQLEGLCSEELRQFIVLPFTYYRRYYPLPSASYSFEQVPCLDFKFDIFAALCVEIWLKPGKRSFDGFEFALPFIDAKNGLSLLKNPEFLGYYYSIAGTEELNTQISWKRLPLVILRGLLNGEMRPKGAVISAASDEGVTYRIPGLEGETTIPSAFADYLQEIGTIDQMISTGVMTEKIANIVRSELTELAQAREASSLREGTKRENTKKARADQLFKRGKRPSSPEVKALGIKPDTAYRYYQEWKKSQNHP
jgi:hypothetical protein